MRFSALNIIYDPELQKNLDRMERVAEGLFWIKEHILIVLLAAAIIFLLLHFAIKALRRAVAARKNEKSKNGISEDEFENILSEHGFMTEKNPKEQEGEAKI